MRLRVAFDVSLGHNQAYECGGFFMEDSWAAKAASKLRQQDERNAQKDALTLERRKLIEEQGHTFGWPCVTM
jgi:hypothetical protein